MALTAVEDSAEVATAVEDSAVGESVGDAAALAEHLINHPAAQAVLDVHDPEPFGPAYPLLAPYLGVLGAFMTGSTTVSNVIFGPVQHDAAITLGYDPPTILGVQLAGASLGNAVCLFNVIAAAAVVGLIDYQPILRRTIVPTVVAAGFVAAVGYVLLWL